MKIAVVQISDLHINTDEDPVLKSASKIELVLNRYTPSADHVFLVITGDIAFSGTAEQYELAKSFTDEIAGYIKAASTPINIILTPGNHDCNFNKNSSVREAVISSLHNNPHKEIDNDIISQCVSVQEEFFLFRKDVAIEGLIDDDSLWSQYRYEVGGKIILFDCLNVAWVSSLHEQQGRLTFPYERYEGRREDEADIRLVTLHHPAHWLSQTDYQHVRMNVNKIGHIILTGHEHTENAAIIDDSKSGNSIHIEAGALQETDNVEDSTFNVIEIDLDMHEFKYDVYKLTNGEYKCSDSDGSWKSFKKLPKKKNDIEISHETLAWLNDPGANYSHPSKAELILGDIFIYPDLDDLNKEDGEEKNIVSSEILGDPVELGRGALIMGQEKAGKTALIRTLYLEYYEQGIIPLYLDLKNVSKASERDLLLIFKAAVERQFNDAGADKWMGLGADRRILFLDDLDRSKVADRYRWKIIEFAKKYSERIIVTAGEVYEISEVTSYEMTEQLVGFSRYHMQSFGHKLRYFLIKKWRCIGNDYSLSSSELISRIDSAEKTLNLVLGKNLVPRVPLYLLTLLQSLEAANTSDIKNSAFGHYYQFLITQALAKVRVEPGEWDEFFNYLSQLAWLFYQENKTELEYSDIKKFNQDYSDEYTNVDCKTRIGLLIEARLIDKRGDFYEFSYLYVYYYFLGKYLSDNVQYHQELQDLVLKCSEHAYTRENANILLFTLHHQKNDFVIDSLLNNLRELFSDCIPVAFKEDTKIFNELIDDTARLVYTEKNPDEHRIKTHERQDLSDQIINDEDELEIKGVLDLPSKLNKLFKTIEILGQLLKSYYGSIKNDRKIEIINDIYSGPLRALRQFLSILEENKDGFIKEVEDYIESENGAIDKDTREKLARKFVFNLVGMVTFGCINKSATATSSAHLRDVSKLVVEREDNIAYRLTNLASRLDMPGSLPFNEINSLSVETDKNIFAHRLLESIVLRHLYFFNVSVEDKQRICASLGITMQYQRTLDARSKQRKLE